LDLELFLKKNTKQANAKIHASSISLIRKLLQIGKQEEGNKKKRWLACFFFISK
jgi:hypothetical protein